MLKALSTLYHINATYRRAFRKISYVPKATRRTRRRPALAHGGSKWLKPASNRYNFSFLPSDFTNFPKHLSAIPFLVNESASHSKFVRCCKQILQIFNILFMAGFYHLVYLCGLAQQVLPSIVLVLCGPVFLATTPAAAAHGR